MDIDIQNEAAVGQAAISRRSPPKTRGALLETEDELDSEGLPAKLAARFGGDDKKAFSVLMSLLNVFAAKADERRSAGGLVASLAGTDLFDGVGPTDGILPGVEFLAAVKDRPLPAKMAMIREYLAICAAVPSLTVAQYFDEIVAPRDAASPPVGPAESPDVAPQKPDAAFKVPFAEIELRIAIERRDLDSWRVCEQVEPGLWFNVELKFAADDWYLDAYLSYDGEGRLLAADAPVHAGGKVYGVYKFMEAQRWVTVETAPQVAAVAAGPDD